MGLFSKKEEKEVLCDICGQPIKGRGAEVADGIICKQCRKDGAPGAGSNGLKDFSCSSIKEVIELNNLAPILNILSVKDIGVDVKNRIFSFNVQTLSNLLSNLEKPNDICFIQLWGSSQKPLFRFEHLKGVKITLAGKEIYRWGEPLNRNIRMKNENTFPITAFLTIRGYIDGTYAFSFNNSDLWNHFATMLGIIIDEKDIPNPFNIAANNMSSKENTQSSRNIDPAEELRKYKSLLDDGVITQEDFDAKKKQLLNL